MKRVAFLGRGVHTLPTYRALVNKLVDDYSITVYSEVPIHAEWLTLEKRYEIKSFKSMGLPRRIREILFAFLMIKEYLKHPFDVVHAHSTFPTGFAAVVLQKLFGVPAIVSLDGAEGSSFPDLKFGDAHNPRRAAINKWIINNAKIVTALTRFQRDDVYRNLNIKKEIEIITRGVELEKFWFLRKDDVFKSSITFLSVGYLSPIKDPETLLKTFFLLRQKINCRLIHIGKDYMDGVVQALANKMNLSDHIQFFESMDHHSVHPFYKEADLLLHTSRFESQGMVVAEAMAAGVIVCGTHVGLMNDLAGECCITAPPQDAEGLANNILAALQKPDEIQRLRMNSYTWTRQNSLDYCAKKISDLYKGLISNSES